MKQLRMSRVALSALRAHKKEYAVLALGIFLAITLVCSLTFITTSYLHGREQLYVQSMGRQDAIAYDVNANVLEEIPKSGLAREWGVITLVGQARQQEFAIGYYDEDAARIFGRRLKEGRMPQAENEIALDESALARLRKDQAVGQAVTLNLSPFTKDTHAPETEKNYILTGILKDRVGPQSYSSVYEFYADHQAEDYVKSMPAGIVTAQAPVAGGQAVQHMAVVFAQGVNPRKFTKAMEQMPHFKSRGEYFGIDPALEVSQWNEKAFLIFLGGSLILCACAGIISAFSNRLAQRRAQIGMLRAVGATRRQIRRLYGRETLLLALLSSPAAILFSLAVAEGTMRLSGYGHVYVQPWAVLLALAISLIVIALAAFLPLLHASRLSPLAVLRNVPMLRRKKRLPARRLKHFDAPGLLAQRALYFRPGQWAGVSVMISLTMVSLTLLLFVVNQWGTQIAVERRADFVLSRSIWESREHFALPERTGGLTSADVAEVYALPGVEEVRTQASAQVNLLLDKVTPYFIQSFYSSLNAAYHPDAKADKWSQGVADAYRKIVKELQVTGDLSPATVLAISPKTAKRLGALENEGRINLDAMDAGQEVAVYAPDLYVIRRRGEPPLVSEYPGLYGNRWEKRLTNDYFIAGQPLKLMQLTAYKDELDDRGFPSSYDRLHRKDVSASVGGVFSSQAAQQILDSEQNGRRHGQGPTLLTTEKGLTALGLRYNGYDQVEIYLAGKPSQETEEYLVSRLTNMAMRAGNASFFNRLQMDRDYERSQRQGYVTLAAMLLLFFSVSLALVNNYLAGRIRADNRAIGMLRAVGAEGAALMALYRKHLLRMLALAAGLGFSLSVLFYVWQESVVLNPAGPGFLLWLTITQSLLVACLSLLSLWRVQAQIKKSLRQGIIGQIRELG